MKSASVLWNRYKQYLCRIGSLDLELDISRIEFPDGWVESMEPRMRAAYAAMDSLERGAVANPDEGRMVGHYWLRAPELAPTPEIAAEIRNGLAAIRKFAAAVHSAAIRPAGGPRFTELLCIGIGGSALGPEFVADALGDPAADRMRPHFIDNTDPDGIARELTRLAGKLGETLTIVTSKSGGTPETRNGMLQTAKAYAAEGLEFAQHAVAITMPGSKMDKLADSEGWLKRFPMFDWVGGRTSEMSAVGLLPAALQGIDIDAMLAGAAACDQATRVRDALRNPAALLALIWFHATGGRGEKDMVVLPYKDRLLLFSRYLQQLVMESLGKERDLQGRVVNQGIAVYGNKGSTDQHAYVQQLREGVNNFFVTFIEVLRDRTGASLEVDPGVTCGDYLQGFLLGTREALGEKGRVSVTVTVPDVSPRTIGLLIALYERVVGFYASLIGINAYHQPGVEAGKKAAGGILALKLKAAAALRGAAGQALTAEALAARIGQAEQAELVFKLLEHLAANPGSGVQKEAKTPWWESTFRHAG